MFNTLYRLGAARFLLYFAAVFLLSGTGPSCASPQYEEFNWEALPVHLLFENHGAPMMLLDPETGVILHANRAARIFYGYPDLSGINISRINTLSPEEIYREMQRARSQKENHFNFRHRLADGSVRDVEVYSYAVTVEGRDLLYTVVIDRTEVAAALGALKKRNLWIVGLLVAAILAQSGVLLLLSRAVARRKKAESALEKQLAFARSLIEVIPNPVFVKDNTGRCLSCNEAYRKMTGQPEQEIPGKPVQDIHSMEKDDECWERDDEAPVSHGTRKYERQTMNKASGERRTVIFNEAPFLDERGEIAGLVAVITDITERKRAEEDLRRTRDYLDKLIQHANAPIIVWGRDFRIIRFNHAFEHMTGYSADEVLGRRLDILFPDGSREQSLELIEETLGGEFWEMVEIPIRRKSGEIRFALWNSANVFADDGADLIATIAQGVDITERKLAEERLRETLANTRVLQKEAESANRAKSAFLANMSHEIRTPLNGVMGFIELLADTRLDDTQREYIGHINTSAHLLLDIISNVLDISKIEAERFELNPVPSDIRRLIECSLVPVRTSADKKGILLSARVEENVPANAVFDPVRLEQVLVNLLSNAVKFTDRGSVELLLSFAPLAENRGAFTFSVRDTGIGISPGEIKHIFDPFYQADSSKTRKYGGTGLGLSISRRLLQQMGSSLEVETAPGRGSRFFFTVCLPCESGTEEAIPADRNALPQGNPVPSGTGSLKEKAVILIAEDERVNRKMLSLLLSKLAPSASLVQAEDGEQAVALFREHRPDLVFMDLQMPGKDGFQATAEIRAMETEKTPAERRSFIVAITADAQRETREECLARGMDAYLPKPLQREEIRAVLDHCLGTERP
ncbi:PAS domain S-box-containing protein [Aminivibrio pyruvatiphilus]|uniref:Sensory/regulatory protein RpfC n=1 Tax=Aminivibrio pyruvatiphilus TaxID=1005740 RepID=A0A4R8M249_9BACT|nr:PAS domain S-box protein [Aminivibrio pyruvatiphilus]TDY57032.1 PAS domain S-box-containing protein [Aminivibrio pyruvatiphilus]